MLAALEANLGGTKDVEWIVPHGWLYVWLRVPATMDAGPNSALFAAAHEAGVLYVPGSYAFAAEGPQGNNTIRLSFGVQPIPKIEQGVAALAGAIEGLL